MVFMLISDNNNNNRSLKHVKLVEFYKFYYIFIFKTFNIIITILLYTQLLIIHSLKY